VQRPAAERRIICRQGRRHPGRRWTARREHCLSFHCLQPLHRSRQSPIRWTTRWDGMGWVQSDPRYAYLGDDGRSERKQVCTVLDDGVMMELCITYSYLPGMPVGHAGVLRSVPFRCHSVSSAEYVTSRVSCGWNLANGQRSVAPKLPRTHAPFTTIHNCSVSYFRRTANPTSRSFEEHPSSSAYVGQLTVSSVMIGLAGLIKQKIRKVVNIERKKKKQQE